MSNASEGATVANWALSEGISGLGGWYLNVDLRGP